MKKRLLIIAVFILSSILFNSCRSNSGEQEYDRTTTKMDTVVTIKAYGPNAKAAVEAAFNRVDQIEQIASSNISTSDVSKINNAAGKGYVKVHPEIFKMVKTAVEYSRITDGAFDITVGPLIKLWAIGTQNERVPLGSEIKAKLPLVGYDKISLNEADSSIMLQKAGMSIDLGGIAKGFTEDEILKVFDKYGIKKAIINLGGSSVYTLGMKNANTPWTVGIQHPRQEQNQGYLALIKVSDKAISTSGDYERYFIKNGKRYHHIINPFTGYPADSGVICDTIVIDSSVPDKCMMADLLTKTVFVLGPQNGMKLLDNLPFKVECLAGTSNYKIYTTPGMTKQIYDLSKDFKLAGEI